MDPQHYNLPNLPNLPKRGDVVKYRDRFYFFQPNGTSSFLYRYQEEIGAKGRAVLRPARWTVRVASNEEAIRYKRYHLKVPLQMGKSTKPSKAPKSSKRVKSSGDIPEVTESTVVPISETSTGYSSSSERTDS